MIFAQMVLEKFHPKPSEAAFLTGCIRDNFRPEIVSDVISGVVVELVGADVRVKFGDSRTKRSRDIRAVQFVMDERTTTTTPPLADGP